MKMKKNAIRMAVESVYDGYINVIRYSGEIESYEGMGLVPDEIKDYMSRQGCYKRNCFYWEVR